MSGSLHQTRFWNRHNMARRHYQILYAKRPIFITFYKVISSHHHRSTKVRTTFMAGKQARIISKHWELWLFVSFFLHPFWCKYTQPMAICHRAQQAEDWSSTVRLRFWAKGRIEQSIKKGTTWRVLIMETYTKHQSPLSFWCKTGLLLQSIYALAHHWRYTNTELLTKATRCLHLLKQQIL